ncbi:HERV-H LTR-associating protein 1 [Dama dama]
MPGFLLPGPLVRLCLDLTCALSLLNSVSSFRGEAEKENVMIFLPTTASGLREEERREKEIAFLDTTELPARSVDLSALNLTELVNGMLNRALKDSKNFFSLLSVTSYSSFAFHKFSVAIYNISNLKTVDPANFPTRYCYCLNNRTNDLSDFTALLVDIIGNSSSYLTEIFKSISILSVSQMNESDCIFICVMTGKSGRNLSDFWELVEKSPVINYTFTSNISGVLDTTPPSEEEQTLNTDMLPELRSRATTKAMARTTATLDTASPTLPASGQGDYEHKEPFPASYRDSSRSWHPIPDQPNLRSIHPWHADSKSYQGSSPQISTGRISHSNFDSHVQKLNPCLMELCRFFQQCLCTSQKREPGMEARRYCLDYYSWFLKNATYICQRVKRVFHSHRGA